MYRTVNVDTKGINYFGRWDFSRAGAALTGWGATYIRMKFTGTCLAVKMRDTEENWWQYSVDGSEFVKFRPALYSAGENTVELARGLTSGAHELFLYRRTEGGLGTSEITGFVLDASGRIAEHDFSRNRRIEFVGDSIVCGFRNAGQDWNDEDSYMAFSVHLARLLEADWSTIAVSGVGVLHNYDEPWPPFMPHLQDYYPLLHKCDTKKNHDFTAAPADVIIIAAGTNDFTDINKKPGATGFKSGYDELIQVVRANNPDAQIICCEPVPAWAGNFCGKWIEELVAEHRFDGDDRLHYLALNTTGPLLSDEHYVGDGTHPNIIGGAVLAGFMRDKVAEIAGWKRKQD